MLVNRRVKGVGFFRTAFYFPSVTSSVAITVLFLFLFSPAGAINKLLSFFGATGPAWFYDPRGLFHVILGQFGVQQSTSLANQFFLGVSYWDWLAGPSIAMCVFIIMAVFTTSGTFMLIFLAGLQHIDESVNEAAALDGATEWKKLRHITVPMIRPVLFTVVTLGLIGTWQVFDQIYVGTKGEPVEHDIDAGVPLVQRLVQQQRMGRSGAAIAFILFAIIVFFTIATRLLTRNPDRDASTASLSARRKASATRTRRGSPRHEQHHCKDRRARGAGAPCGTRAHLQLPDRSCDRLHLPVRASRSSRRSRRSRTRPPTRSPSSHTRRPRAHSTSCTAARIFSCG